MAGVTDALVAMAQAAADGELASALQLLDSVRRRHLSTVCELLDGTTAEQLNAQLHPDFERLKHLLSGVAAVNELSPRTLDYVLSFGEILSSRIVSFAFRERGIKSSLVNARDCVITDANHTRAVPRFQITNTRVRESVMPLLRERKVPVIAGFIAATEEGVPTTLGRGGSDFSAAVVGAALSARRIEIWTDVQGMMTTDPRLCPDAQRIDCMGFDEAAELAYFGAKVLHPATLIPAMKRDIPVWVLNSRDPNNRGTCIRSRAPQSRGLFRAIAAKKAITVINVKAPRMLLAHGFLPNLFSAFERHKCPVDLVSTSEVSVSVALESAPNIRALAAELKELGEVEIEPDKAIICLVGENIRGRVGLAASVFSTIASANISVHVISQGASEINISFVIDESAVPEAVRHLHARFFPAAGVRSKGTPMNLPRAVAASGGSEDFA
jgi:aspartate kinase